MMINVGIKGTKVDLEVLFFVSTNTKIRAFLNGFYQLLGVVLKSK